MSFKTISRRKLLTSVSAGIASLTLAPHSSAINSPFPSIPASNILSSSPSRELKLYNSHTGERINVTYWEKGQYITENLQQLNLFLRDHRNGTSIAINTTLLDALYLLKETLNCSDDVHIISAYRSKETNEMLRKKTKGVAKNSFHTLGKAIDIQLPNTLLKESYQLARNLKFGGVGFYEKSGFIHLDTGPVRHWSG